MIYVYLSIYIFIIFPIFTKLNMAYINADKKLYFTINIFGLSVVGGDVEVSKKGLVIKIGKKKTIIYSFKKLFGLRKRTKTLKDFHIICFCSLIEYGNTNNIDIASVLCNIYVWHNEIVTRIITFLKPYLKVKNDVNLYHDKNKLSIFIQVKILLNVLSISIILVKLLKEKISNAIK